MLEIVLNAGNEKKLKKFRTNTPKNLKILPNFFEKNFCLKMLEIV